MIEVFDCQQGSADWYACRLGLPTASEFHKILMRGRKKEDASKTRRRYMLELIGERMTGQPRESFSNWHMDRGKGMEAEALDKYAFLTDSEPARVGFVRNGQMGCSPDSLIDANGLVQIKTMIPPLLLDLQLQGDTDEHECQLYGELLVTEREWNDLFVYWPGIKPFRKRVYRDETKIKSIALGVEMFLAEMQELMNKLEAS